MTGLFGVLDVGANGLKAATFGTAVTSENASNVATDGYTRRTPEIKPLSGEVAGGARAGKAIRVVDTFIERRLVSSQSVKGEAQARTQTLSILDSVFSEDAGSISNALSRFEAAVSDLASMPDETAARTTLLERADQLAQSFSQASSDLTAARVEANKRIIDDVTQVNSRIEQIADLNGRIARAVISGKDASTLIDQRDKLVREIASYLPVTVLQEPNDRVTLLLSGSKALVTAEGTVSLLRTATDASTGDVHIYRTTTGSSEDISSLFTSGSIGGYIAARDGALQQAREGLDQLAYDVISAYNTVHAAGVGLDSGTGRNLFEPVSAVQGAAANFQLSADVDGHPEYVAAAQDSSALPGDNRGALELQALQDSLLALGGTATAAEGLQALVSSAGSAVQRAQGDQEYATLVTDQLVSLRESVSGVSTDEEMIALSRYQSAYQASVRVVEVTNLLLEELMGMAR